MKIVVPIRQVPDLVEELEIDADGTKLNTQFLKYVMNEWDDQALEEAILLKEGQGADVTVIAIDGTEADQILFAGIAKGADRALKIEGDFGESLDSHTRAKLLSDAISSMEYDLILMGVQAPDDLDGLTSVLLAANLGLPHTSVVTGVKPDPAARKVTVYQEYSGGIMGEMELDMPALIGIQAASQPPRYVPISRLRQAMMGGGLESVAGASAGVDAGLQVRRLFKPESASHAEMIEGSTDQMVERIMQLLSERGMVK
jgi:electron transfer flavoprotein beta subunit